MSPRSTPTDAELRCYEGLAFRTEQLVAPLVEDDLEDIQQMLRIKVWSALVAFDPARATKLIARAGLEEARDRSVFAWVLRVLCLLYRDYKQSEVARTLDIEKRDVERCVRAIRTKMCDWRPDADADARAAEPVAA